jgi:hypothetical protein
VRYLLAACCLVLASCAADHDPPEVRACKAQSSDDPEVRRLIAINAGSESFQAQQGQLELEDARKQATLKCLRARGLAPPGGVERPRREHNLFDGLF